MGKLFGGREEKSVSTPVDTTPSALRDLREPFVHAAERALVEGRPAYQGPFVAPITAGEQTALTGVNTAATNPLRQDLINQTLSGQFLPGSVGANPWLDASVAASIQAAQAPVLRGLEHTLSRVLPGRFTQAGHLINPATLQNGGQGGSSAFDVAAGKTITDTSQIMADQARAIAAPAYEKAYEAERQRQQEGITLSQNDVNTMVTNLQASGLPRLIEDKGIERGIAEFQDRMKSIIQALAIVAGAPIAQQGQQTTSTATTSPNIFGTLFPKGLQA